MIQPGHVWSLERATALESSVIPYSNYAFWDSQLLVSVVAHLLRQCNPLTAKR